jgi:hypothetical protein
MTYDEAIDIIMKTNQALAAFAEQHKGEPGILRRWIAAFHDPENAVAAAEYDAARTFVKDAALATKDDAKVAVDKLSVRDQVEAASLKVSADRAARMAK